MARALKIQKRRKHQDRVRQSLRARAHPRLSVARSLKHIYAQVIDDHKRQTLAQASSIDKAFALDNTSSIKAAEAVGKMIAERAKKAGIDKVVFDRGRFLYHGRVKALAQSARDNGLKF